MCINTKYTLGLSLDISYTSVYDIIYQVYCKIQEYMTVYTRFTVVLKRLCRYILMTCKYILVYTIPEHCDVHCDDVHCDVAVPSYTVKSHHNTVKLPSYTPSSLYVPGMTTFILSIRGYMTVYASICGYKTFLQNVHESRIRTLNLMHTPRRLSRPLDHEC